MTLDLPSADGQDSGRPHRSIASVRVERLHGKFTYELDIAPSLRADDSGHELAVATVTEDRLTLLYGSNGTGKTSLLRLLFHALSPSGNRGHRSAMRRVRFREFSVFLTDGSYVRYLRNDEQDLGSLLAEVRLGTDGEPVRHDFGNERVRHYKMYAGQTALPIDEAVNLDLAERAEWLQYESGQIAYRSAQTTDDPFLQALAALGINPVFLEDSRAITSDVLDAEDAKRVQAVGRARAAQSARARGVDADEEALRRREVDIEEALERVRLYLSQLAFAGTQAGSFRVDTVYVNVARAIIQHSATVEKPNNRLIPDLRKVVRALNERAARFQAYGLLPESPMLELAKLLEMADDRHGLLLDQVLSPHLEGFEQRMKALEPGLAAVAAFVDALNSFLRGKRVRFSPGREGLSITDQVNDERIYPNDLSSGEKQIVLMFSDIIALQDETKLFLIDEPELSLNPDWQRALMPSLLGVTEASGMQLVAATHSIEIMARYRDRRRQLPS